MGLLLDFIQARVYIKNFTLEIKNKIYLCNMGYLCYVFTAQMLNSWSDLQ